MLRGRSLVLALTSVEHENTLLEGGASEVSLSKNNWIIDHEPCKDPRSTRVTYIIKHLTTYMYGKKREVWGSSEQTS